MHTWKAFISHFWHPLLIPKNNIHRFPGLAWKNSQMSEGTSVRREEGKYVVGGEIRLELKLETEYFF